MVLIESNSPMWRFDLGKTFTKLLYSNGVSEFFFTDLPIARVSGMTAGGLVSKLSKGWPVVFS